MKKGRRKAAHIVAGLAVLTAWTLLFGLQAKAAEYEYQADTNTYTVTQTSGDVTAAIRNALAEASGTQAAPAVIKIQPGQYTLDCIEIKKSHITVVAEGAAFTGTGVYGNMLRIVDGGPSNITVKGGSWNGGGTKEMVFFISGDAAPVSNVSLIGCEVSGAKGINVRVSGVDGLAVEKCYVQNGEYGVLVLGSKNVVLNDCVAKNNANGFALRQTTASLNRCNGDENKQCGLQVKEQNTFVTVSDSSFCRDEANGISLTNGASLTLQRVDVSNNKFNGISPVGETGMKTYLTATDCKFNQNGRHGVAAVWEVVVRISDCEAKGNANNGIFLNEQSTGELLYRINASGNGKAKNEIGGSGIFIKQGSTATGIEKCICNDNDKNGISVEGASIKIKDCSMDSNQVYGFYHIGTVDSVSVENSSMDNNKKHGACLIKNGKYKVTFWGCSMDGNAADGVLADANKVIAIKDCTMNKNGNCGVETSGSDVTVTGKKSTASNNKKHGIVCRDGKLVVKNMTAEKNKNTGVFFCGAKTKGSITASALKNNLIGVCISEGATVSKVSKNTFQNNTKYNLMVYAKKGAAKSSLKACQKNKMTVKKSTGLQISFESGAKVPSRLRITRGKAAKDTYGNTFAVGK